MMLHKLRQEGFHLTLLLLALVVVAAIGFVGWTIFQRQSAKNRANQPVVWQYDDQKKEWVVKSGVAPVCREPYVFDMTPFDLSQATSAGMPGSYRASGYKPHGGFRLDNSPDGVIDIKMPVDAKLVGITRYYEGNPPDLQYLLTFETDCGIAFRFDHIAALTPKLQEFADKTPPPKLDDTRSSPNDQPPPIDLKAGEVIATAVGFSQSKNFGFDFGVYDYRQRNQISNNPQWAGIHEQYSSLDWHGVCWFSMFPGEDAARAEALSHVQVDNRKPLVRVSDYCSAAPHTTLDFNNGQLYVN